MIKLVNFCDWVSTYALLVNYTYLKKFIFNKSRCTSLYIISLTYFCRILKHLQRIIFTWSCCHISSISIQIVTNWMLTTNLKKFWRTGRMMKLAIYFFIFFRRIRQSDTHGNWGKTWLRERCSYLYLMLVMVTQKLATFWKLKESLKVNCDTGRKQTHYHLGKS